MLEHPEGASTAAAPGRDIAKKKLLDFTQVLTAERAAIEERRAALAKRPNARRNRSDCAITGVALSGGGIRSASFGLGALQALDALAGDGGVDSGIEGIDYLSTVSGGGYIGCALTAAMQKNGGRFPFTDGHGSFKDPARSGTSEAIRTISCLGAFSMPWWFSASLASASSRTCLLLLRSFCSSSR
jgi:predicted acylesterase/phospholipase RssA